MEQTELPYQVRLEHFEGPLDLLLHLIKKNEINIYDIPIALIASQYLDYLNLMKALNLSVAGEFLVVAATLIQIKSKQLLPVEEREEDEDEGPDPQEELVRRLLEYKQFKEAGMQLDHRERLWRDLYSRELAPAEPMPVKEYSLDDVTLFDLVDALQGVIARLPTQRVMEIIPDNLTVRSRMNVILERLEGKESVTFLALFEGIENRMLVIVTFLALLELIKIKVIRVIQGEMFGSILVTRSYSTISGDEMEATMNSIDELSGGIEA